MAWSPEIQVRTEGGTVLALDTCQILCYEVILALHVCLIWDLPEKGALSLPFVIHAIASLLCVLSTQDGIFSFLSPVLLQPYVLVPSFTAIIF